MSSLQTLKQFVNDRLVAAAEEIFGVFQQTVSELENELNRQREQLDVFLKQPVLHLQPLDVQKLRVTKQEDHPEQVYRPSLDLEDPEPPNDAGEKQEKPALVQVKSEDEVQRDEQPSTSSLIRHIKTEVDEDNCGGSEPELYTHQYSDHQRKLSSEADTDDSEDWRDTHEIQSDSNAVEAPKVHGSEKKDKPKSLKCSGCGRIFSGKRGLALHICRSLTCLDCSRCFKSMGKLQDHMRIHTGEKPYICSHCGRCFAQSGVLKVHMRSHTGEKPYICPQCGKGFITKGNLDVHMKSHSGEKPFACSFCDKHFILKKTLQRHIKVHTR